MAASAHAASSNPTADRRSAPPATACRSGTGIQVTPQERTDQAPLLPGRAFHVIPRSGLPGPTHSGRGCPRSAGPQVPSAGILDCRALTGHRCCQLVRGPTGRGTGAVGGGPRRLLRSRSSMDLRTSVPKGTRRGSQQTTSVSPESSRRRSAGSLVTTMAPWRRARIATLASMTSAVPLRPHATPAALASSRSRARTSSTPDLMGCRSAALLLRDGPGLVRLA